MRAPSESRVSLLRCHRSVAGGGPYARVGGACAPTGLCASTASTGWQTGWAAGAGIEWAFSPSLSARLEYLHYDLGTRTLFQSDPGAAGIVFGSSASFSGDNRPP